MVKTKTLSKVAEIIYKASCLINLDGMYILYCSLLLPYINYCSEMWGNAYVTNIKCITVMQKQILVYSLERNVWSILVPSSSNCSFIFICKTFTHHRYTNEYKINTKQIIFVCSPGETLSVLF